jgi:hypothetical protein
MTTALKMGNNIGLVLGIVIDEASRFTDSPCHIIGILILQTRCMICNFTGQLVQLRATICLGVRL